MLHPDPIPHLHLMHVAGATAICLVCAGREDRAEDAMLHMKHRHVLMDDYFKPLWWNRLDKLQQLLAIQIVGNRDPPRAVLAQIVDRQLIGRV